MELLKLSDLSPEQCTKITQQIVRDLVRAFNLGNYSLLWRYLNKNLNGNLKEDLAKKLDKQAFDDMQQDIISKHGTLESFETTSTEITAEEVSQEWTINTSNGQKLKLSINFIAIKEFLAITDFTFSI